MHLGCGVDNAERAAHELDVPAARCPSERETAARVSTGYKSTTQTASAPISDAMPTATRHSGQLQAVLSSLRNSFCAGPERSPVRSGHTCAPTPGTQTVGDGTVVHLRLLPGLVDDYCALVDRALEQLASSAAQPRSGTGPEPPHRSRLVCPHLRRSHA